MYDREPFKPRLLLVHTRANQIHAQFGHANAALACQRGLEADPDPRVQTWFHFEDAYGHRITVHDQPRSPGHAYALIEGTQKLANSVREDGGEDNG